MNIPSARSWAAIAATVVALAACSGGATRGVSNKGGGDTVVLHLATIDGDVNFGGQLFGPQAFVDALTAVSGGRLEVEVTRSYGDRKADAESRLVQAIASGTLDGGWPATRAFSAAGIAGLEAVEAPMTITSYAAEKALVSGPVADAVLRGLDGSGVVGLGLAVGPLRRPFAARTPLLSPGDWQGIRFRSFNSPVQADAVRALGGEPVNLGIDWSDELAAGRLRGAEFDVATYAATGSTTQAGSVASNVVLWPKVFVISLSQKRFDALTDQQRHWVQQAAKQAVQASVDATYDESTVARGLCEEGARFVAASPEQIAALHGALAPVLAGLAADPTSGPLLADIQAIAAQHPEPDVPDVPASCQQAGGADAGGLGPIPEQVSAIPDGTYRQELTRAEVDAAGLGAGPGFPGTWTFRFADGTYQLTCRIIDDPAHDCGNNGGGFQGDVLEAGHLRGTGNTVYFVFDHALMSNSACKPPQCADLDPYWMTWTLNGDLLTLTDHPGGLNAGFALKPWQKIG